MFVLIFLIFDACCVNITLCEDLQCFSALHSSIIYNKNNITAFDLNNIQPDDSYSIEVNVIGNIKQSISLNGASKFDKIRFFGLNVNQDKINFKIEEPIYTDLILDQLIVAIDAGSNDTIEISKLILIQCFSFSCTAKELICDDLTAPLEAMVVFSYIKCNLFPILDLRRTLFTRKYNLVLDAANNSLVTFAIPNNKKFGFFDRDLIISEESKSGALTITFVNPVTLSFVYGNHKTSNSFINYYQYQNPFFDNIDIRGHQYTSGEARFLECEWFTSDSRTFFNIECLYEFDLHLDVSLPANLYANGTLNVYFSTKNCKIDRVVLGGPLKIQNQLDHHMNLYIETMEVGFLGKCDIENNTSAYIRYLLLNNENALYFQCDSLSEYTVTIIHALKTFNLNIDDIRIEKSLILWLPDSTNKSIIRSNMLEGSGYLDLKYNFYYFDKIKGNPTVLTIRSSTVSELIKFQYRSSAIIANESIIDVKFTELSFVKEFNFYVKKLPNMQSTTFCFGNSSVCDVLNDNVLENEKDYDKWLDNFLASPTQIIFKLKHNVYTRRNLVNFYRLSSEEDISLKAIGKDENDKCAHNQFVLDGLTFYEFADLTLDCVNASIVNTRSKSTLNSLTIKDSYIDSELEKLISEVEDLFIDLTSLKRLIPNENTAFKFESTQKTRSLTLYCANCVIKLYSDFIMLNDTKIEADFIYLYPEGYNFTLIGCESKKISYHVNISGEFQDISVHGVYPPNFLIYAVIENRQSMASSIFLDLKSQTSPIAVHVKTGEFGFITNCSEINIPKLIVKSGAKVYFTSLAEDSNLTTNIDDIVVINSATFLANYIKNLNINNIYTISPTTNASHLTNFKKLHISQDYGPEINFFNPESDITHNTVDLPFSIFRLPKFRLMNGRYEGLHIIFSPLSKENELFESKCIKANPEIYLHPFPIICGESIACETWNIEFKTKLPFFSKYYELNCTRYNGQKCLVGALNHLYIYRDIYMYIAIYTMVFVVIFSCICILCIRIMCCHRTKKDKYKSYSSSFSSAGVLMI